MKKLLNLVPFVIVTIAAYGLVELLYGVVLDSLFTEKEETGGVAVVREAIRKEAAEPQKYTDYSVIYTRNLFQASDLAGGIVLSGETDPFAGIEATKLDLVLMGTITGEEGGERAIVYNKRENKQEIFYKGDVIEGALIKTIHRGRVILEYQGNDEVLDMSEASTVRPRQPGKVAKAAVSPVPVRRKVLSGPKTQTPRRRVISSGARVRRLSSDERTERGVLEEEELIPDEQESEEYRGIESDEYPRGTLDEELIPEEEAQQGEAEQIDAT